MPVDERKETMRDLLSSSTNMAAMTSRESHLLRMTYNLLDVERKSW